MLTRFETKALKIKVVPEVAKELLKLYDWHLVNGFDFDDSDHDVLLKEHMVDMHEMLFQTVGKMALNNAKCVTLQLTGSTALAFLLTWNTTDLGGWPLADVLVRDWIGKIDKRRK